MIYLNRSTYTINSGEIQAVLKALNQNKIYLREDVTFPDEYKPIAQINLEQYGFSNEQYINWFFPQNSVLNKISEFEKTIFVDEVSSDSLSFGKKNVIFEKNIVDNNTNYSKEVLRKICDDFVNNNSVLKDLFEFDTDYTLDDNTFRFEYRQKYENDIIYDNYIVFYCEPSGIYKIETNYLKPISKNNKKRDIIRPDEATFLLMQRLINLYKNKNIEISKIDIVFKQNDKINDKLKNIEITPYYRFIVATEKRSFLVNAYTGDIE